MLTFNNQIFMNFFIIHCHLTITALTNKCIIFEPNEKKIFLQMKCIYYIVFILTVK